MAMNNKQRWMGGVVLLGGGALLAALLLKGQGEQALGTGNATQQPATTVVRSQNQPKEDLSAVHLQPLTIDVETERRLLEKQREQREKAVAEQEARTAEYLALQQKAEAEAARRAAEEYAAQLAKRQARLDAQAESSDSLPPELIDGDMQQKTADEREEIQRLAAQANIRADEAHQASLQAEQAAQSARDKAEKARGEKEALQKAHAEKIEKDRQQAIATRKAEAEARKKQEELTTKQKAESEAKRKEDEAKRKKEAQKQEELAAKRKAEEDVAAKRKAEADARIKKKEEELAEKRKDDEEAKRKKEAQRQEELAAKRKADETRKKQESAKQETEAAQRKTASPEEKELQTANKKLDEERGRAILEGETKPWMVQVSIASTQANADAIVARLRAKGYKVKTSQTSKGVRVMVGPEKGRAAADALRNQVAKDTSLNAKSAWVIDWQPPQ